MGKRNEWVNRSTGEVKELHTLNVVKGRSYPKGLEFHTMFLDGWKALSDLRCFDRTTRVLMRLMAHLDYQNWLSISQQTLAEELGIHQPDVAKAINELVANDILERQRDKVDKRRWAYRFNARLGWRGDASEWAKEMQSRTAREGNVIPMPGVLLNKEMGGPPTPTQLKHASTLAKTLGISIPPEALDNKDTITKWMEEVRKADAERKRAEVEEPELPGFGKAVQR